MTGSINFTSNDFNTIRDSLKAYLKAQTRFKDYDFDGSNLSVLIDLLAQNTFFNQFNKNMLFAESFLPTAKLRQSIVSKAKDLNYTPRSVRSAKARVKVSFEATSDSQPYIIQKGESFSSLVKSDSYVFSIPETITVASVDTNFEFETDIFEGVYVKDSYVIEPILENRIPRYRLQNKTIDTTSLSVKVFEDGSVVGDTYILATSLLGLDSNSKVFFLQASENGYYEILFGDNVLGRSPKSGSTLILDYRVSSGSLPNGAKEFSINFNPTGQINELITTVTVETVTEADGGSEEESDESIRYYAPRNFQVQERATVASDYEIILKSQFPEINDVSAFGGDELIPPQYGKVFVAVDINDVDGLPDIKKKEYSAFLDRRNSLTIKPIIIEPEYTYLSLDIIARYNINVTTQTKERIESVVLNTVTNFNEEFLNGFNKTFRYSQLVSAIDDSDPSIISNVTKASIYKKITPTLGSPQNIDLNFNIPLKNNYAEIGDSHKAGIERALSSSQFTFSGVPCKLEDDGAGNIRIINSDGSTNSKIISAGTINYDTGEIKISNFNIDTYQDNAIKIFVRPRDPDVEIKNKTIFSIETGETKITVEPIIQ